MKLYSENKDYKLYNGSMLDMLEVIEPNTIDSIVTDPPYGLTSITKRFGKENSAPASTKNNDGSFARLSRGFMGKEWDGSGIEYNVDTWKKCYEVLKPGGYLLAFGGSRTFHRIACAIEDAGFEIRDTIMWLYGSGFPKSMDISKQIDKRPNKTYEAKIRFGELIKKYRNKSNLTQRQLGELIGVSRELINLYEIKGNNQQQIPTKEQWKKIKKILNIYDDMDYIYEEAEREVIGTKKGVGCFTNDEHYTVGGTKTNDYDITIPSTDLAKKWQGWGTALKPSFEPIIVARKPFKGSLVDNVLKYGVGGINIDECRVGNTSADTYDLEKRQISKATGSDNDGHFLDQLHNQDAKHGVTEQGRFPANTILTYDETDFDEVCGGFPYTKGDSFNRKPRNNKGTNNDKSNSVCYGKYNAYINDKFHFDSGSASRYFYCAKASKKDRDEGLDGFEEKRVGSLAGGDNQKEVLDDVSSRFRVIKKNVHPTVKPTELMQYLVRLVTPNSGTVLDPFNGSGSTGKAVMYENKERNKNYKYIGIELTEEYLPIAKARIEYACNLKEDKLKDMQMSIFDIGESNE